jgi:hypothetical protein
MPKGVLVLGGAGSFADALRERLDANLFAVLPGYPSATPNQGRLLRANLLLLDSRRAHEDNEARWTALHVSSGLPVLVLLCREHSVILPLGVVSVCLDEDGPVTPRVAEAIARGCSVDPQGVILSGDLLLGVDARRLARGGDSYALTVKECRLLQLFMSRPGQVLDRKALMREVWDTDYTGDTRTIDVHICWLRRKLEEDPRHPVYLRTVRSMGYRFEARGA